MSLNRLKCDRGQPCGTCDRCGLSFSCTYVTTNPNESTRKEDEQVTVATSSSVATNIPDQIGQLEQLVTSLMTRGNTSQSTEQDPTESQDFQEIESPSPFGAQESIRNPQLQNAPRLSDSFDRISLQSTETSYVDNTHWTAVLDGVRGFLIFLILIPVPTP
jgi:hypothetical protein